MLQQTKARFLNIEQWAHWLLTQEKPNQLSHMIMMSLGQIVFDLSDCANLGGVHTWRLFWSCRRLFYITILWNKPCFQKSPERFLKRHRQRLFLQLWAFFSSWKKFNFSEKNAPRQAPFWQLTNDKRVARKSVVSITTRKKMEKVPVYRLIVILSEHKELYDLWYVVVNRHFLSR